MSKSKSKTESTKKAAGQKPAASRSPRAKSYAEHMARWESWQEEKCRLKREQRKSGDHHKGSHSKCLKKFDKFKKPQE